MINRALFTSKNQEWETPQELFNQLNEEFNFTIDLAGNSINHKLQHYYNLEQDSLKQDWSNQRAFLNPPYGRKIGQWIKKCAKTQQENRQLVIPPYDIGLPVIVALLPARTSNNWFHKYCYNQPGVDVRFIKGRLKFELGGEPVENSAPFPSMIVIWR